MDEFIWIPDWNAQGNTKANISKIQFGDGYVQRQSKGMNTLEKSWSLTFNARSDAELDAIEAFLEARFGVTAFTWTAPGQDQAKYTCDSWSRTEIGYLVGNITLQFVRTYEP